MNAHFSRQQYEVKPVIHTHEIKHSLTVSLTQTFAHKKRYA